MRSCSLLEVLLVSRKERKAKRVAFDPKVTIVLGENDTGKSSLLKSIYWTFGAGPAKVHTKWESADIVSAVRFAIGLDRFTILRRSSFFAVFDGSGLPLATFTSVTNGLGPFLASLFDFGVRLPNREGKSVVPPPAYLFLPFYIDQDSSWKDNWSGFSQLNQFSGWREAIAEYHAGLRSNEYYEIRARLEFAKQRIDLLEGEVSALKSARDRFQKELPASTFDIDINSFKEHVNELLQESQHLSVGEEKYKVARTALANSKAELEEQLRIAETALKEFGADYNFATENQREAGVECPTCGALYENSVAERFAIARDEERCMELILDIREDINGIGSKLEEVDASLSRQREDKQRLDELLAERTGEIRLRDVIESEGRKEVGRVFKRSLTAYYEEQARATDEVARLKSELKMEDNGDRREEIVEYYLSKMRQYLHDLEVVTIDERSYARVSSKIKETGSDLPRALLAYYYSVIWTSATFSSAVQCPIVIDSPNQQGQDPGSLKNMIQFILKNRPPERQLIVGLENLLDLEPEGTILKLEEKHSLLQADEYQSIAEEISELWSRVLSGGLSDSSLLVQGPG